MSASAPLSGASGVGLANYQAARAVDDAVRRLPGGPVAAADPLSPRRLHSLSGRWRQNLDHRKPRPHDVAVEEYSTYVDRPFEYVIAVQLWTDEPIRGLSDSAM